MIRIIIILSILLAASVAANVWQYQAAAIPADPITWADFERELAARAALENQIMTDRHADEVNRMKNDLNRKLSDIRKKNEALTARLAAERRAVNTKARAGDEGLRLAVLEASGTRPDDVAATGGLVSLQKPAALQWIDLTLELKAAAALCDGQCRAREHRIQMKSDLDILAAEHQHESAQAVMQADLVRARANADRWQRTANAKQKEKLTTGLLWGGVGLGLGLAAGFATGAAAL